MGRPARRQIKRARLQTDRLPEEAAGVRFVRWTVRYRKAQQSRRSIVRWAIVRWLPPATGHSVSEIRADSGAIL